MKKSGDLALQVTDSLNRENPFFASERSSVPFVFDGEIIVTASTVNSMWNGIVEGGFTIQNPVITSIDPIEEGDYQVFRNSWEMDVFFRNKMPRYAYRVSISGIEGNLILLIYRNQERGYSIIGLKAGTE
ncbi:MAG: hypothetical protein EH225_04220 [Calditrichaeota bacterium]|nr:MAG: hypothetical protein EH225_04220 [Calditrichota bacterium]